MHGQAKVQTTEKQRREREQKVKAYKEGMSKIFEKRKNEEYTEETLELISDILVSNPDIYTLWNFRKEILLTFKDRSHDDLACVLSNEMRLTEVCLRANPKSYCAWYHRLWLLDNIPNPDLEKELFLCTKYLKLDERNFHCWDYRRAVVSRLRLPAAEELLYTTQKIEENFSNYSSWHYRSNLLPLVHPDQSGARLMDRDTHLSEVRLVQAACFTDPCDSSSWFYLRWLLGRPPPDLALLQAVCTHSCVALVFSRHAPPLHGWHVCPFNPHILIRNLEGEELRGAMHLEVDYGAGPVEVVLREEGGWTWGTAPRLHPPPPPHLLPLLQDTLASCNQLLQLEPDSKWTLLSSVVVMQAVDGEGHRAEILRRLAKLVQVDPLRAAYYTDLRSKYLLEQELEKAVPSANKVSLKGLNLTFLCHLEYLAFARAVDLSGNQLGRSLRKLVSLLNCEELVLDSNSVNSLKGFPKLAKLKYLSLRSNNLSNSKEIIPFISDIKSLETIDLTDNPLTKDNINELKNNFPNLGVVCSV